MDKIRYTVLISHPSDVDEKTLDFIYQCFDMWNEQNQALPFEFYHLNGIKMSLLYQRWQMGRM